MITFESKSAFKRWYRAEHGKLPIGISWRMLFKDFIPGKTVQPNIALWYWAV